MCISNEDGFKCELERFGTKFAHDHTKDILSKEQYEKFKSFKSNTYIITRKADNGNIYVILDRDYHEQEINKTVNNEGKLIKIEKDQTIDQDLT